MIVTSGRHEECNGVCLRIWLCGEPEVAAGVSSLPSETGGAAEQAELPNDGTAL